MVKDLSILGEKFSVELHKNIPVGSGLGGGSSNAATLMRMLRLLWAPDMPLDKLATLGASLGADIPLFIHGWSSQAHGAGEKLLPIYSRHLPRYYYLVFCPHVHSSTAELFATLAQDRETQSKQGQSKPGQSKQGQEIAVDYAELEAEIATNISHDNNAWLTLADGNDFLSYVIAKYPKLNQLRDLLHSLTPGKLGDQIFLSGTGSSMFAVYADKEQATEAQQRILNSCCEQAYLLDDLPSTAPFASTAVPKITSKAASKLAAKGEGSNKHNDSECIQFAIFLSEGIFCNAAS